VSKKVKTGAKKAKREDNEARTAKETSKAARQLGKGFDKETARANTGQRGSNGNCNSPTGTGQERTTDKAAAATEAKRQTANGTIQHKSRNQQNRKTK
jgi:hypothetical protein